MTSTTLEICPAGSCAPIAAESSASASASGSASRGPGFLSTKLLVLGEKRRRQPPKSQLTPGGVSETSKSPKISWAAKCFFCRWRWFRWSFVQCTRTTYERESILAFSEPAGPAQMFLAGLSAGALHAGQSPAQCEGHVCAHGPVTKTFVGLDTDGRNPLRHHRSETLSRMIPPRKMPSNGFPTISKSCRISSIARGGLGSRLKLC